MMNAKNKSSRLAVLRILMAVSLVLMLCVPLTILGDSTSIVLTISPKVQTSFDNNQKPQQKPAKETIKNTPIVHLGSAGVKKCFDIEKEPEFRGGEKALIKFVNANIHYPLNAQKAGVEGTVIVRFVVNIKGNISDVKLKKGIGSGCDEEALRVVKAMPAWNPGRNNGKVVPVMIDIPIEFQLTKKTTHEETIDILDHPTGLLKDHKNTPLKYVEQKPKFKGGKVAMLKFLKDKLKYPIAAKNSGFEGTVIVQFVVEETGKISRVKTLHGFDNACDEEANRLVKSMPNWIPGRMNGQAVSSIFQIPIKFELPKTTQKKYGYTTEDQPVSDKLENETILDNPIPREDGKDRPLLVVEQNPEFKGGYNALLKYLKNNMIYPITAKKEGIQGTVFVYFVVERNGKITSVKLLRGIGKACDEEAIRLVKSMPAWIPGRQDGKVVRVMFQIPVKFQLPMKY